MSLHWKEWHKSDIAYAIIAPTLVVLLIVAISKLPSLLGGGAVTGIVMELEEMLVIAGVPLTLGLVWNQWAGGASGFLLGSIYALYWSNYYQGIEGSGTILMGYVLSAMLIGYMAGALNKQSENFIRLMISGVLAATIGGVILFGIVQLSPANLSTGINGFSLMVLPRILSALIVAVIAKNFYWNGMGISQKSRAGAKND